MRQPAVQATSWGGRSERMVRDFLWEGCTSHHDAPGEPTLLLVIVPSACRVGKFHRSDPSSLHNLKLGWGT